MDVDTQLGVSVIRALHIDGIETPPSAFVVPEMSLSSARSDMRRHDFTLTIDNDAMIAMIAPAYAAMRDELERDYRQFGGDDELSAAGFPPVEQLSQWPAATEEVLGWYLRDEFLGALTRGTSGPILYWFDESNACEVEDGLIRLSGTCYGKA